jgi:general secretion pathway protein D
MRKFFEPLLHPYQKKATLPGWSLLGVVFIAACSNIQPMNVPNSHIQAETTTSGNVPPAEIPTPVASLIDLPRPKAQAKKETYSVSVREIPAQELLFALSRDAKLNIDVHPGINGLVTINAIDQTLEQILTRIAKQVDMRWEIDGQNLIVMPDAPFLHTYKVDYVNMSRDVSGTVSINTQIASTSSAAAGTTVTSAGGNNSTTTVTSRAKNNFWDSVEKNIKDILRETDKILPEGSSETVTEHHDQQSTSGTGAPASPTTKSAASNSLANSPNPANMQQQGTTVVRRTTFREAASVIVNPEVGVVVVRATARQHEKVQEYIDLVTRNAGRQVMIEATIAEVSLKDTYTQGINWQSLRSLRNPGTAGFSPSQNLPAVNSTNGASFLLNYVAPGLGISATLTLLENFGNVKVLSSPKISVLNNQTAMLKVVDNIVYFTVKADTTTSASGPSLTTVTTTPNSVSVGLVMSVTPQISDNGNILLNVRPSISKLIGDGKTKKDPNPSINIDSFIPEIQTREMESMLRLTDGEIAVMGGLMSDELSNNTDAVPGLSKLPGIGTLFTSRNDITTKKELVIFIKPTIIRDPSIRGDYRNFRSQLPTQDFFKNNPGPEAKQVDFQGLNAP